MRTTGATNSACGPSARCHVVAEPYNGTYAPTCASAPFLEDTNWSTAEGEVAALLDVEAPLDDPVDWDVASATTGSDVNRTSKNVFNCRGRTRSSVSFGFPSPPEPPSASGSDRCSQALSMTKARKRSCCENESCS